MRFGPMPKLTAAPAAIGLEDVTNGYVPWSRSSSVPWAPSKRTRSPALQRAIDEERRVRDVRRQPLGEAELRRHDLLDVVGLELVHALEPDVLLLDGELELLAQDLRVEEILDANPDARGLVRVGGADAAPGRSDLKAAEPALARAVERDVPGHHEMRVPGDEEHALGSVTACFEVVELGDEHGRIDDTARADRAPLPGDDPGRDLADLVRLARDDDRVPGVGTALVAAYEVGLLGQQVDDLPFALVAPLRADDDRGGHVAAVLQRSAVRPRAATIAGSRSSTGYRLDASTLPAGPGRAARLAPPPVPGDLVRRAADAAAAAARSGSATAVASPPTTNAAPTERASPSAPSPTCPPTPPTPETIESKETTVARCSRGNELMEVRLANRARHPEPRRDRGAAREARPRTIPRCPRTTAATV